MWNDEASKIEGSSAVIVHSDFVRHSTFVIFPLPLSTLTLCAMSHRLLLQDVRKSFGATAALRGVSLAVAEGEVHALIGENGAGKSTLMKILSGAHEADSGRIELDGQPFAPRTPLEARRAGVAMIYQELNLARDLSVAENITLGAEPSRWGWLRRDAMRDTARRALAELGHGDLPLDAPVGSLSIAEQQLVEIARALAGEPRVIIFDEPTSSLTQADAERLFAVIARLKARGTGVIYISHFLEECRRVCDRFTVLRDGESVDSGTMAETPLADIIRLMVGREVSELYPKIAHECGEVVLSVAPTTRRANVAPTTRRQAGRAQAAGWRGAHTSRRLATLARAGLGSPAYFASHSASGVA